ncbi:MAG: RHS repeat-associated core domain-containing protein, partial [Chitinophagaceae bacterium]
TLNANFCTDCFAWFINDNLGTSYTYEQIALLYQHTCGINLLVCKSRFDCKLLTVFSNNYTRWYNSYTGGGPCDSAFTAQFNDHFNLSYTFDEIMAVYELYCGQQPMVCNKREITNSFDIEEVYKDFRKLYPYPAQYFGDSCQSAFTHFFNHAFSDTLTYYDIARYYLSVSSRDLDICFPDTCLQLQTFLTKFNTEYGSYHLPQQLCHDLFTALFNTEFAPKEKHLWPDIEKMYARCGDTLSICAADSNYMIACQNLEAARKAFYAFNGGALPDHCSEVFTQFFNLYFKTSFGTYEQLEQWAHDNCSDTLNICDMPAEPVSIRLRSTVSVTPASNAPRLCGIGDPIFPPVDPVTEDPCDYITTLALNEATEQYQLYLQQQHDSFDSIYAQKCLKSLPPEIFTVQGLVAEYHYTLYYYDQAGNLVKTVPPEGVNESIMNHMDTWHDSVEVARQSGATLVPDHVLPTNYRFNTLNQVITQESPDGGLSHFFYDRIGRLVISQNAKQLPDDKYGYTKYDVLGRITEVGEITGSGVSQELTQDIDGLDGLGDWFTTNDAAREQITNTYYDLPANICDPTSGLCQTNLRNRVSYSTLTDAVADANYASATYYSYDIHGNVDTLLQHYFKGIMHDVAGNAFKKIIYQYDLISGKVNEVTYQKGQTDEFYHRYKYDPENRLTEVYTSHDHVYWERQAKYDYYKHGPLARMEVGQLGVQGVDYAYTLHGWLKGVNSTAANDTWDMGEDGPFAHRTAMDVYGFSLNYYDATDYKAIKGGEYPFAAVPFGQTPLADGVVTGSSLFNGNIASMMVNMPKLGAARLYGYRYDQLNRIRAMNSYIGLNNTTNILTPSGSEDYNERVTYDANGNIRTYLRNGANAVHGYDMDELTYQYPKTDDGRLINNRLRYVHDNITGSYTEDIKTQTTLDQAHVNDETEEEQSGDNYGYDNTGNLIKDEAEGITSITWTLYGKIASISKTVSSIATTIDYTYDVSANRISKKVTTGAVTKWTWYVRDASGNVMAIYEDGNSEVNDGHLSQIEVPLYGSSRLGVWHPSRDVQRTNWWLFETTTLSETIIRQERWTRGNVNYELSNHLGNVLATVSDRKLQLSDGGSPAQVLSYEADLLTANDYYPFGMGMPGRKFAAGGLYRYGFNGKENDDDAKGEGNQQDYGMRIYDPRIGKFLSIDPVSNKYPHLTPYQFASNRPIDGIDLDGLEFVTSSDSRTTLLLLYDAKLKKITSGETFLSAANPNVPDWLRDKIMAWCSVPPDDLKPNVRSGNSITVAELEAAVSNVTTDPSGNLEGDIKKIKSLSPSLTGKTPPVLTSESKNNVSTAQSVLDALPGPSLGGINNDRLGKGNAILTVLVWAEKIAEKLGKGAVTDQIVSETNKVPAVFTLIQRAVNNDFGGLVIPDKFLNSGSLTDLANYIFNGAKILDYTKDAMGNFVAHENTELMKLGDDLLMRKAIEENAPSTQMGGFYKNAPAVDQTGQKNF